VLGIFYISGILSVAHWLPRLSAAMYSRSPILISAGHHMEALGEDLSTVYYYVSQ
jgi:hypothetical protein